MILKLFPKNSDYIPAAVSMSANFFHLIYFSESILPLQSHVKNGMTEKNSFKTFQIDYRAFYRKVDRCKYMVRHPLAEPNR